MKKEYVTPIAQKVHFSYRQQVVTASTGDGVYEEECDEVWTRKKGTGCHERLVSYGD